jgi:hypothetical protein
MQPSEADGGLERFWSAVSLLFDRREQGRYDLREAVGGGRGGSRGALGAVGRYLGF